MLIIDLRYSLIGTSGVSASKLIITLTYLREEYEKECEFSFQLNAFFNVPFPAVLHHTPHFIWRSTSSFAYYFRLQISSLVESEESNDCGITFEFIVSKEPYIQH